MKYYNDTPMRKEKAFLYLQAFLHFLLHTDDVHVSYFKQQVWQYNCIMYIQLTPFIILYND